jgi:predicted MFS family arabinose efflux permease
VAVWHILLMSFTVGCAQAFGGPAYQALIPRLVKGEDLQNAIALNSIQFNLARVIGPVIGGVTMAKLGAAWCFGLNGISYVAVMISLLLLHERFTPVENRMSMLESMKEGIRFVRQKDSMEALIFIAFFMTLLGVPLIAFLPVFAKDVFKAGPDTYSILLSVSGMGSVTGALFVAGIGNVQKKGRVTLTLLILLGILICAFAWSSNFYLSCALLFVAGATLIAGFAMISSLVQLIASDAMRGRVMSVYNVAFRGGMPVGSLITGKLISWYSAPFAIAVNGALLAVIGAYFLFVHRRVAKI